MNGEFVGSLSLDRLPALVHIGQDGSLVGCAEGWNPPEWKQVLEGVGAILGGLSLLPDPNDPGAFEGTRLA